MYLEIDKAYMMDGKEHLSINDAISGEKVFPLMSSNKKSHVEPDKKIIDYIENAEINSLTTVHNHPRKGTFSIDDIIMQLSTPAFKESIVITNDGEIFFFSEGNGDKIDLSTIRKEQIFSRYVNLVRKSIENQHKEMSTKEIRHQAWIEICEKRGWIYGYKKIK